MISRYIAQRCHLSDLVVSPRHFQICVLFFAGFRFCCLPVGSLPSLQGALTGWGFFPSCLVLFGAFLLGRYSASSSRIRGVLAVPFYLAARGNLNHFRACVGVMFVGTVSWFRVCFVNFCFSLI